jgi:hypothetical protein
LDVIDEELVELLRTIGNEKANSLLEANLDRRKPTSGSKREVREEYINEKYVNRSFCVKSAESPDVLSAVLYDMAQSGEEVQALVILRYVLLGANLRFRHPESGGTLLHAVLSGQKNDPFLLVQLLVFSDCPTDTAVGPLHKRPLHVAASMGFVASCRVLLRNGADPTACTAGDEAPLDLLPAADHPQKIGHTDIEM